MLASPAGSKVVMPGFERPAHFVPIAAIVIQTATRSIGDVRDSERLLTAVRHPKLEGYRLPPLKAQSFWRNWSRQDHGMTSSIRKGPLRR
jgi:hypothetical protein